MSESVTSQSMFVAHSPNLKSPSHLFHYLEFEKTTQKWKHEPMRDQLILNGKVSIQHLNITVSTPLAFASFRCATDIKMLVFRFLSSYTSLDNSDRVLRKLFIAKAIGKSDLFWSFSNLLVRYWYGRSRTAFSLLNFIEQASKRLYIAKVLCFSLFSDTYWHIGW